MRTIATCLAVCGIFVSSVHAAEVGPRKQATQLSPADADAAAAFPVVPVSVVNLPAVQSVEGTVQVSNLPLAEDGSLRVVSAPTRRPVMIELLDAPIVVSPSGQVIVTLPRTVDTTGYSDFGIYIPRPQPSECYGGASFEVMNRWSADEAFTVVYDNRNPPEVQGVHGDRERTLHRTMGGEMQVTLTIPGGNCEATYGSVRVYLFPQ